MADSNTSTQETYNVYADPNSAVPISVQASSIEEAQKKAKAQVAAQSNKKDGSTPTTQAPLTEVNMPANPAADGANEVNAAPDNTTKGKA